MRKALSVFAQFFLIGCLYGLGHRLIAQTPPPAQPIPVEQVKAYYVDYLEIQLQQVQLTDQQKDLDARKGALNAKFQALLDANKVNATDWSIDLKSGVMTKRPTPAAEEKKKK